MNEIRPIRDVSDRPATLMSFTARFFCPAKRDAEKRCPPPRRDGLTAVWIAVANDRWYFFLFCFNLFVLSFGERLRHEVRRKIFDRIGRFARIFIDSFFGKERIEISDLMDVRGLVFWFSRLPDIRSLGFYLQTHFVEITYRYVGKNNKYV